VPSRTVESLHLLGLPAPVTWCGARAPTTTAPAAPGGRVTTDPGRRIGPRIAAKLVLSARTVDNHLQNVYSKLGASSRDELAQALRG